MPSSGVVLLAVKWTVNEAVLFLLNLINAIVLEVNLLPSRHWATAVGIAGALFSNRAVVDGRLG